MRFAPAGGQDLVVEVGWIALCAAAGLRHVLGTGQPLRFKHANATELYHRPG